MLYSDMRYINFIFTIFGMRKPFPSPSGKSCEISIKYKVWSLIIAICIVVSFICTTNVKLDLNIKENFEAFYKANDMVVNAVVVMLHYNDDKVCLQLYEVVDKTLLELKISNRNLRMIVTKFYIWLAVMSTVMIACIILEILKSDPYVLIIMIPTFLSTLHLVMHLGLVLCILKVIVTKLKTFRTIGTKRFAEEIQSKKWRTVKYFCSPSFQFLEYNEGHCELNCLCKMYDHLSTCVQLLEQYHGVQMLLALWLLFTNAVFGVTMIARNKVEIPILVIARSMIPFAWCFIGCLVNNQITEEVEHIDVLIVKFLIDFRCDQTRKTILQTFKQLVSTSRLHFTACSLFHLNFSMVLVTIANIITYSIILIQLFVGDTK